MRKSLDSSAAKQGRDMTVGSIPRHLIAFSMPMLAVNVIQTSYSIINAVWVGKGLGKADLAAVTVSFPIVFVLIAIAIGVTIGSSILVSQFAGAREWERLRQVVQTSTVLLLGLSVFILVAGQLTMPWIIGKMNTPASVYPLAVSYMRIFLFTMPFSFGTFLLASLLRGIGDSKTPLYFQGGSLLLNAGLDPVLMFGWLGAPKMGLSGTAVASVVVQFLGLIATFVYLHKRESIVAPDWRRLKADMPMLLMITKIGLPSAFQQALVSIGMLFVLGIVNRFGENATATFGAAMRIDQIAFLPAMTVGASVSTLVGQNIGANRLHRVTEIFRWGVMLAGGITLLASIIAVTAPMLLLRMFLNDATVIRMGVNYLHIVGACYLFFAIMFVANGVLNGAGHTLITTIISIIALWAARVPLAVYLSNRLNRVEGVWYAMAISFGVSMVISLAIYSSGYWKRPVVHHGMPASCGQDDDSTEDAVSC